MPTDLTSSSASSQGYSLPEGITDVAALTEELNKLFTLLTSDVQRITTKQDQERTSAIPVVSGTYRLVAPYSGQLNASFISTAATTGSDGSNYHTLRLTRNGVNANSVTQDTRYNEVITYQGGKPLGSCVVSAGDVLAVSIATTGSPSALTVSDILLRCELIRS